MPPTKSPRHGGTQILPQARGLQTAFRGFAVGVNRVGQDAAWPRTANIHPRYLGRTGRLGQRRVLFTTEVLAGGLPIP